MSDTVKTTREVLETLIKVGLVDALIAQLTNGVCVVVEFNNGEVSAPTAPTPPNINPKAQLAKPAEPPNFGKFSKFPENNKLFDQVKWCYAQGLYNKEIEQALKQTHGKVLGLVKSGYNRNLPEFLHCPFCGQISISSKGRATHLVKACRKDNVNKQHIDWAKREASKYF